MPPAASPSRTIALVRRPDRLGVGVFRLTLAGKHQFYTFVELRCEIGGRGFAIHRLGLGTKYHVRVGDPADCDCDCLGFLRHGHCKHVLGLRALVLRGLL
jgi:hypothetical protein